MFKIAIRLFSALIGLFFGLSVYAEARDLQSQVYQELLAQEGTVWTLAQKLDYSHLTQLILRKEPNGHLSFEASGVIYSWTQALCISPEAKCTTFQDVNARESLSRARGRGDADAVLETKDVKEYQTEVESYKNGLLRLRITRIDPVNGNRYTIYQLQKDYGFRHTKIEFAQEFNNIPRRALSEVPADWQNLEEAIFQIEQNIPDRDSLRDSKKFYATGFFISRDGYFVSNHHVAKSDPDCMALKNCHLIMVRKLSSGLELKTKLNIQLIAASSAYDMALFKAELPTKSTGAPYLTVSEGKIGPEVLTVGYPNDRYAHAKGALTFSEGQVLSLDPIGVLSTLKVTGGASGSPVFDKSSLEVVGLIRENLVEKDAASIFTPMSEINDVFELNNYLNGNKQRRVEAILRDLEQTRSLVVASKLLRRYQEERTYLGTSELFSLVSDHPVGLIRRLLKDFFEQKRMLSAP